MNTPQLDELAHRLQRLEDIEEIRRLKHRYCALCDEGYRAEQLAELFTPDGIWEASEPYGRAEGRDAIVKFFRSMQSAVRFSVHSVTNPIIDIEGATARARWCSVLPATLVIADGRAVAHWLFTNYDDTLVKVDGRWLFSHMRSSILQVAEHSLGWK